MRVREPDEKAQPVGLSFTRRNSKTYRIILMEQEPCSGIFSSLLLLLVILVEVNHHYCGGALCFLFGAGFVCSYEGRDNCFRNKCSGTLGIQLTLTRFTFTRVRVPVFSKI